MQVPCGGQKVLAPLELELQVVCVSVLRAEPRAFERVSTVTHEPAPRTHGSHRALLTFVERSLRKSGRPGIQTMCKYPMFFPPRDRNYGVKVQVALGEARWTVREAGY